MFSFLSQSPCSLSPAPLTSTIFITANVLLAGGQLLPHSSTSLGLLVRLLLTLSHLAFSAWSLTVLCSGPAFCWHSLLALASLAKLSEALWRCWPARINSSVLSLYTEVFQPLAVSKEDFLLLLKDCRLELVEEVGRTWCREGGRISSGLSLLLTGRLTVTTAGRRLHKIEANQAIQSIEWEARRQDSQLEHYQVEVEVEEAPASILHLNQHWLDKVFETRQDLKLILEAVIGKDISLKLYMMNKMIGDTELSIKKEKSVSQTETKMVKKSSSLDAINTGWRGFMRSHFWTAEGRGEEAVSPFNPELDLPRELRQKADSDRPTHQHKLRWPNNRN